VLSSNEAGNVLNGCKTGCFSKPSVMMDATDRHTLGLMPDPPGAGDVAF